MADAGIKDLHIIANDAGNDKADGIGTLIVAAAGRASLVASHVGLNPKVAEQMNAGTLAGHPGAHRAPWPSASAAAAPAWAACSPPPA